MDMPTGSRRNMLLGLLAALVIALIYWFGLRGDPKVATLNQSIQLSGSPSLKGYPYKFKVLRVEGATAVMSTPRSSAMPVYRMIGAIEPRLAGTAQDNPDFIAAEQRLGKVQAEAREIVLGVGSVTEVKWELDENWLFNHGILMN